MCYFYNHRKIQIYSLYTGTVSDSLSSIYSDKRTQKKQKINISLCIYILFLMVVKNYTPQDELSTEEGDIISSSDYQTDTDHKE